MSGAVHKRSGKRHAMHADELATLCGRIVRRKGWKREPGEPTCRVCRARRTT